MIASRLPVFQVEVPAHIEPALLLRLTSYGPDFIAGSVAAVMGSFGNFTRFHLAPSPTAWEMRSLAEAIEGVLFRTTRTRVHEIRTIAIGAGGDEITGLAFRTLDAMSDAERHLSLLCASGLPPQT